MVAQEFDIAKLSDAIGEMAMRREIDLSYLPTPNHVDLIKSDDLAPPELTTTAFVIPFYNDGSAVFATHAKRHKLEIPGGHIEPGETMAQAAARELHEETGYRVKNMVPIGYQRLQCEGPVPEGYKYPYPVSFQQFFAGAVAGYDNYTPNEECAIPTLVELTDNATTETRLDPTQRMFMALGAVAMVCQHRVEPTPDLARAIGRAMVAGATPALLLNS